MRLASGAVDAAVRLTAVSAGYRRDVPVLDSVSLTVPSLGVTRLNGRNGAGKSTVCELVSGYLLPWAGSVEVGGRPAADPDVRPFRRVCRSRAALHPAMSVRDHLSFAALNGGHDLDDLVRRSAAYGLQSWWGVPARELSTGNARKLWLILCTSGTFRLVVLDEPMSGLDAAGRELLVSEIHSWSATASVLLVTHEPIDAVDVQHEVDLDRVSTSR